MSYFSSLLRLTISLRSACRSTAFYSNILHSAYFWGCEVVEEKLGTHITDPQRNDLRSALDVPFSYKVEAGTEDFCMYNPPLIQHTGTNAIAHEFAHASSPFYKRLSKGQQEWLRRAWVRGKYLFPYFSAMLAASRSYAQYAGRAFPLINFALKSLMVVSAAAMLPRLAEEAQASVRGCMAIGKVMGAEEALKSAVFFAVCFGSYLLPLAEGVAMPAIFAKEAAVKKTVCGSLKKLFRRKR